MYGSVAACGRHPLEKKECRLLKAEIPRGVKIQRRSCFTPLYSPSVCGFVSIADFLQKQKKYTIRGKSTLLRPKYNKDPVECKCEKVYFHITESPLFPSRFFAGYEKIFRDRLFSDKMLYFSYRRGLRRALLLSQKYGGRIRRGSGNIVI